MSALDALENSFKPEARSAGSALASKGLVRLSRPSDLEITAFIKASASIKVSLQTDSFDDSNVRSQCNCPQGKKAQLCKHVWAVLQQIEDTQADFLEGKSEITVQENVKSGESNQTQAGRSTSGFQPRQSQQAPPERPVSASQEEFLSNLKKKQADHRKQQYQKQKQRLKDMKQGKKKTSKLQQTPELPDDVEKALGYFSENGFPMEIPFAMEDVRSAKKKLSRVFHPDVGGSHDEIVTLNDHFEVLIQFLEK